MHIYGIPADIGERTATTREQGNVVESGTIALCCCVVADFCPSLRANIATRSCQIATTRPHTVATPPTTGIHPSTFTVLTLSHVLLIRTTPWTSVERSIVKYPVRYSSSAAYCPVSLMLRDSSADLELARLP